VQVGFSSTAAGNVEWAGDSVACSFEETKTIKVENKSGAETPGVAGAEAALEAAAEAALA
jgi:hypothetical protein